MLGYDLRHQDRDLVGRIEFPSLLTGVRGEVADQVLVDEAQDVVILPAVRGNVLDQVDQILYRPAPCRGRLAQLGKAGLQRGEYAAEQALPANKPVERRQGIRHVAYGEIAALGEPRGKQVAVRDKIAVLAPNQIDDILIVLVDAVHIGIRDALAPQELQFLIGKELVENESQYVVLVLVRLDLRTHLVCRRPYLGRELLLVHIFIRPPSFKIRHPATPYGPNPCFHNHNTKRGGFQLRFPVSFHHRRPYTNCSVHRPPRDRIFPACTRNRYDRIRMEPIS